MKQEQTNSFYLSLIEFLLTAKQHIAVIGSDYELTPIQTITLLLIDERVPRPMKNLCQLFHCDASNITGIVDGLETKGLVSRQNDMNDRRIKVLKLELAGRKLQSTIIERLTSMDDTLFASLEQAERRELTRLISKLSAAETLSHSC